MSFKKYKLFTDDDLQRLRQKHLAEYNPNLTVLSKLQGEIESLLESNTGVANDDKIKLLSTLEQRFNSLKQNEPSLEKQKPGINPQVKIAIPPAPMQIEVDQEDDQEEEAEVLTEEQQYNTILDSFDPLTRPRVSLLLDSFADHPEIISFDNQQRLILNGAPINNSNIINSLKRLLKIKTPGKTSLSGQKSFTHLISQMNLPIPLLNRIKINLPKRRPPGKKSKTLSLY
jgi:hypothetical protein